MARPRTRPPAATQEDEAFVQAMVQQHGRALLAYATRLTGDPHLAEDVVQETLLRAWRHRADLQGGRGSPRGWLLTVVRNLVIDRVRARDSRPPEVAANEAFGPSVGDHADATVDQVVVLEALDQLSEDHRSVLVELYLHDRTVNQAADVLGVPPGTVKSRSYYALRALRSQVHPAAAS
jgi:RNA polymerase sigma-70 factor (ECF subfamily)